MSTGRRTLTAVAAVATCGLLVVLALVLSQSGHHRTGTTGQPRAVAPAIPPKREICQVGQDVAAGTGGVGFHAEREGGPLAVAVKDASGVVVARGSIPPGSFAPVNRTVIKVPEIRQTLRGATVCIQNLGSGTPLVYGERVGPGAPAAVLPADVEQPAGMIMLRIDYLEPRTRSWWSFAPEMADRFGLAKARSFGAWTFWAEMAGLLALAIGTIWYAARAVAR